MAYDNNQNEYPLPADGKNERKSESLLPRYFRTEVNKKFLQSTLDQLVQPGVAEKLNGYFGRRISKAFRPDDNYVGDISSSRENYQFEPAVVIKDELENVSFYKDYNDYINQVKNFGGNSSNHSVLNAQEYYAWNPNIDWDKFVNFREYYWLPYGPQTVVVAGQSRTVESTIKVTLSDNVDNVAYVFSSDELVQNPTLILYRGQTYTFDLSVAGTPFSIKTKRTLDASFNYDDGVTAQGVESGTITFRVGINTPEILYYVADNDINNSGLIQVKDIEENTEIDVEREIIGKVTYKTEAGFELSNGMKIRFAGFVTPEKYAEGEWYVEGVGDSIKLVAERDLEIPGAYSENRDIPFDSNEFDRLPFDNAAGFATNKDYIVINRASSDRNPWTRYNRWFHRDVIERSAEINQEPISVDQSSRATRPIIEFSAGLKLFNFGTKNKRNVDLIDTFTTDIFSTIEGAIGYNIDGVALVDGMRVLFVAEQDEREAGKILKVKFINHKGQRQISLIEEEDSAPLENETVLALNGVDFKGRMFYYDGTRWHLTQEKTGLNQQPLFDLFDDNGFSYGDTREYPQTTFAGNKVFSYRVGTGTTDPELGFALSYRSIENIGDIVFDFNLLTDNFTYRSGTSTVTQSTDVCVLKKHADRERFSYVNGWQKAPTNSSQDVLRQYVARTNQVNFPIDVYQGTVNIETLRVRVTVNNLLKFEGTDYDLIEQNNQVVVRFRNGLVAEDVVVLRTRCNNCKNNNGIYEIASNLEKNPQNNNISSFTLGEVNDHVSSIVTEVEGFRGEYPGRNNLRDLGNITQYGKKFLQHTGPINLALYHLTNKSANIVKALDYSRREYAKFKRIFLQKSLEIGFDGNPKEHVDLIFKELNREKNINMPFYFSDMAPTTGEKRISYTVFEPGNIFYALSAPYNLDEPNIKAVTVYVNDSQLLFGEDYTFNEEGFCVITSQLVSGDRIDIYEYETTDGSYIPPTPTKLGMYPKFKPEIFTDNTYVTPVKVIQGHDGSIVRAFDDYRDDLILELEKRIYNNIKVQYDPQIIDRHEFLSGEYRNTGIAKVDVDNSMLKDFAGWLSIVGDVDYTNFDFYNRENSFTYNYSFMSSPNGNPLPGYWRAVYKQAYDTDRPHTSPWEMLGFSEKPVWWETQYGPAPYTSNNLLMWEDLEKGIIAEPGKARRVVDKYKRPGLTGHLPVDEQGRLLSPLDSKYARNYVNSFTRNPFTFGDEAPTETAWRRSSEYPFSLLKAWILNQPSKIIGLGFDRYRSVRNAAGQLVYKETGKRIRLADLFFPNNSTASVQNRNTQARVYSAGFINFIANYLASNVLTNYDDYKNNLRNISNQLGFKIGGYTDKSKFNLILDSRTPLNQGNVFVPEENFNVVLQTSSPLEIVSYSGVVIEKTAAGFILRGYDTSDPVFTYLNYIENEKDPTINVGGISESFVEWVSNQRYVSGAVVSYNNSFFRVKESHTSTSVFDATKFVRLPELPRVGGRSAIFRSRFNNTSTLAYGTLIRTVQGVVDFLLGYGEYLISRGFVFNNFNAEIEAVENWKLSAKEFMFWTTQNWDDGALFTVSPAAQKLQFRNENAVVDNVFDTFYDYSLVKADGTKIRQEFTNIGRDDNNGFTITLKNTADGIYAVKLPLVQKEHVVLVDNETVFRDVIYDPEPGYRQERIRVLGYRVAGWNGSLTIPGFIYDEAVVTEWTPWKDYAIGDVVKYKEFYYTATRKISGSELFDANNWYRLSEKPTAELLTNLEYKTNQFADFYDLDTDNFDVNQQEIAQHLIGYQKRDYLSNIINDDVSQYKFYQGFIQDKGTLNALTKLFDALGSADKDSLEFYEEWAVRVGQYGAADGFEEVEFLLDESQFRLSPQPILLTDTIPEDVTDLVYRQLPNNVFLTPQGYDHAPFPSQYRSETVLRTAGYVREEDVQWTVTNKDDILTLDAEQVKQGDYVWVTYEQQSWNVYKHVDTAFNVIEVRPSGTENVLVLNKLSSFKKDDIIGVYDIEGVQGFYKVLSSSLNTVRIATENPLTEVINATGIVTTFISNRVKSLADANAYAENNIDFNELIWVDSVTQDGHGRWNVIKQDSAFSVDEEITNPLSGSGLGFGNSMGADSNGEFIAVGAPDAEDGKVYVYRRREDGSTVTGTYNLEQTLTPIANFDSGNSKFGSSVTMSPDGKYLIVGAPDASNVKSAFKDNFNIESDYTRGSIVQFNESLFRARRTVRGQTDNVVFGTHDSASQWRQRLYEIYGEYADIPLLTTGDYPLTDTQTDHILVRAPADAYEGSVPGDALYLNWNDISNNYIPDEPVPVFDVRLSSPMELTIAGTRYTITLNTPVAIEPIYGDRIFQGDRSGTIVFPLFDTNKVTVIIDTGSLPFISSDTLPITITDAEGAITKYDSSLNITVAGIITEQAHGLRDGDEIVITDIPNDGLTVITDQFDNSDPALPRNTQEQRGIKGLEPNRYFIQFKNNDVIELYFDADLTNPVNGAIGFTGSAIPNGEFNGNIRKINKPFDNRLPNIDKDFIVNTVHTIRRKVDEVFYVVDPINVPNPVAGDRVTTATGNATVVYVKNELGRLVIYANNKNGVFDETGELFINDTFRIGDYTRPLHDDVDRTEVLGGWWEIPTGFVYNPNGVTEDIAEGLVIQDLKNGYSRSQGDPVEWFESATRLPYKSSVQNVLDNPPIILAQTDRPFQKEGELIRNLSYIGLGIGANPQTPTTILDDRFVVRLPANVSEKLAADLADPSSPDPVLGVWLNRIPDADGNLPDISNKGFGNNPWSIINRLETPIDLWDGYIDYAVFDASIEIAPGDLIREGNSGARATVAYFQRDLGKARIYVKDVIGDFTFGSRYFSGPAPETTFLFKFINGVATRFGTNESRQLADSSIGKLAVFRHTEDLPLAPELSVPVNPLFADDISSFKTEFISGIEYHTWVEEFKPGLGRQPLLPSTANNDWEQVQNIPVNVNRDASQFTREGAFFVYEKNAETQQYVLINGYVLPNRENDRELGFNMKLIQHNDLYKLCIGSDESHVNDSSPGRGRIYFVLNGADDNGTYNWSVGKDRNYKGIYSPTVDYYTDQVVVHNGVFYRALTNLQAEQFDPIKWKLLGDRIDFVGYVPNTTGITIAEDSFIDRLDTADFGNVFDVSDNGNILATIAEYELENRLVIYRLKDFRFELLQEISAPANSRLYGAAIAVSDDGNLIAVGAPDTDSINDYQGKVYVYRNNAGTFALSQTLESPNREIGEGFGAHLGFDGNQLVVTSAKGDIILDTTYDRYQNKDPGAASKYVNNSAGTLSAAETIFDSGFTKFQKKIADSGLIYIYENLSDTLVYGQRLEYDNFNTVNFGKNVIIKNNNIFVGMPGLAVTDTVEGKVIVYNRPLNTRSWTVHREPIDQIEINKFRGSFIYDTKENDLLARLDIIDPIAGKVSGLAEQELSFKTYYDPATYNVGNTFVKDQFTTWGKDQVGKLWWDLSTVKYVNYYQGNIIYSQGVWNTLAQGSSIDVYEWVESSLLPSQWDAQSETNQGTRRGFTGLSKYGDEQYVVKQVYDKVSQSFKERYYFWVKGKKTTPNIENRRRSALDVENIIRDPSGQGLRFVTILGNDRFVLHNCNNLVKERDIAVNFRYWTIDNQENNIHSEYQIITDGLETSRPKRDIEEKWFDSLIGMDRFNRPVPDPSLSVKQKYGSLNRPRQSMFVNRAEALKQYIERVNRVLAEQLTIDNYDISRLQEAEAVPTLISGRYDSAVDTEQELRFVGTVRAETARLEPVIVDGVVESVRILGGGRGYRVAPSITIQGTGEDLELRATINNLGTITNVEVVNGGTNYADDLSLTVRPLSVLVRSDSELNGAWAIYGYDSNIRDWVRTTQQQYNVANYWQYKDWYAEGFSELTSIDFLVQDFYQLNIINDNLNDIVKVENVGTGGWILLQKTVNIDTPDYSVNYRTIGRQNGTIEFLPTLYTEANNSTELRIILETIRDSIFVNELANEYNQLFFASLRYVFSEQNYVDWAFKTSFVKAKHNVGELEQRITYQNDNLPSYEEYIREVKPYKTSIREYLSSYAKTDNTQSIVTDFDLSPFYNTATGLIEAPRPKIQDGVLTNINFDVTAYPDRHWLENFTYEVVAIEVDDGGSGYVQSPLVTISGGGGTGATARAFIGSGSIKRIIVTNPGTGFTRLPTVTIEGTQNEGGRQPRVSVILGNKKVRTFNITQKFDRVSPRFEVTDLDVTEEFTSSGSELTLRLKWPMDLTRANIQVFFDDVDALTSEYSYGNEIVNDKSYTRSKGFITLEQARPIGSVIRIEYKKAYDLLSAADRINLLYDPQTGQYGKDLGQLMDGVDYGGVEVRSFEFGQDLGWDTQPWYTSNWDTYDENFDDETFITDGSTTRFKLSKPLEAGSEYNIYINGIRIDDPNYDGSTKTYLAEDGSTVLALGNPNAIMKTVTTESSNYLTQVNNQGVVEYFVEIENIEEFEEYYTNSIANSPAEQVIVIRKSTSDGSFIPQGSGFDSIIEGGNLAYGTATGLAAQDINIDGDGFVTPTTSKGPEELVPGQVLDTLDLKVYDRASDGGSLIAVRNYTASITQNQIFNLDVLPHNISSVIVKVDGVILSSDNYEIDFANKTVTLNSALTVGQKINIISMSGNGESLLDINNFIGDGITQTFVTNVGFQTDLSAYVAVDGVAAQVEIFETDSTYGDNQGLVGLRFVVAPDAAAFIYYAIYKSSEQSYSEVSIDRFEGDGSTAAFSLTPAPFTKLPASHNVIVKLNNKILYPGYTQNFTVVQEREYPLDRDQFGPSSLSANLVDVYLNGQKLALLQDYRWDFANTQVVLFDNVGSAGDNLDVYVLENGEYRFSQNTQVDLANVTGLFEVGETVEIGSQDSTVYTGTVKSYSNDILILSQTLPDLIEAIDQDETINVVGLTSGATANTIIAVRLIESGDNLILNDTPQIGDVLDVYKFSDHDIQDIQMGTKINVSRTELTVGSEDYYDFNRLTNGLVKLRRTALDEAYVWVVVNGDLLTANVDYRLAKMNNYVQITRPLNKDDVVQVIHFAASKTNERFGYRIFKDILNRTHYKRLNKDKTYVLAQDLNITDQSIVLVDATGITKPSKSLNLPGVLFIEGERIEYFEVNGNTLSQLRRGTLGTGARTVYTSGTELMDQSVSETIPYTDEMISSIKLEDESTRIVLDWMPENGVNEFEVFVGGRRLRKNTISKFDLTRDQDSPEGDVQLAPEFTLENGNQLVLANPPVANSRVLVIRKVGKRWQLPGEQLRYAQNTIAEFIRGATTDLPK